ncbi:FAD-dependent pyridine nucleotide-disulfide oxidoreductase [Syntrophobotulus glycolicus DSM 8271]|uniref:FAD-dependent pyridine nucleotide-disulfide oxidoreductase n=1 Tax=Syntrophobotulus glycolicus (strain DSM 8271 / FlGlyR) TaxID=645991 RepID=F0SYP9_SYNGF|nr:NAD(P)/FAD-dependent oxidoreductase [Syntrophobotulus glycolicus]ADY54850.1 FAD-dependent pyridine nucleotide-disulfide oxidoreductase [Syntrophobotulus glycolicus DSM 8271]
MDIIWPDLKISIDEDEAQLPDFIGHKLGIADDRISNFRVLRRAVDARKKPSIYFVYTVGFTLEGSKQELRRILSRNSHLRKNVSEPEKKTEHKPEKKLLHRPVVIGAGPAGYFAALALAEAGYKPLVLERGEAVENRGKSVQRFWQEGRLNLESNVQFGEGGAGTFSDGKLTTRIHDDRTRYVLDTFVQFGASPEILFQAKPHIGTDVLTSIVKNMRKRIQELQGEVRFETKVTGLSFRDGRLYAVMAGGEAIPAEAVILAVGNSARDVYGFLFKAGVMIERKPFAIGLRIEHDQSFINWSQYGMESHPRLGAAEYQLTYKDSSTGRGAYSFCMCPGGRVIASSSEEFGVVTNGMSEWARDSGVANSAIVVTVRPEDFSSEHPLAGVEFQRSWEHRAFLLGGESYRAPAQNTMDFINNKLTGELSGKYTYAPGVVPANLRQTLPPEIGEVLARSFLDFDRKIKGFLKDSVLTGVETRTSAPVRILRDETGQSPSAKGLFPAGEGAGYAGGIMSSAVDGLRMAEKLISMYTVSYRE